MASVNDSPAGDLNGKVGGLVYYKVGGKTYVRQAPSKQTKAQKKKTPPLKLLYQSKMTLTQRHLKSLKSPIAFGFQNLAVGARRPFHACVSYTLNNSFIADGPKFAIDPSLIKVSRGPLLPPLNAKAEKVDNGFYITWQSNAHFSNAKPWDKAFIVLHYPDQMFSEYITFGNDRSSESQFVQLWESMLKKKCHVNLAFSQDQSNNGNILLSDSVYLGWL
ncbi:DUF6266 family protein [Aquiflexum gelatinilyticum]|uniref:DUF6266 family protein n=1 Tax=Aquiflexum gelatinilyticum TaxID=2961943 RepID=UPI0021692D30|nr:DUF6266 family protein [Aquiflexum gelatinilyticum]MCS4436303.1 DUF6266 family protein [Aquiflexum gelatinilyticum]